MKCARLKLQERPKTRNKQRQPATGDQPRHYCQQRLVIPEHHEHPGWIHEQFRCYTNPSFDAENIQDVNDVYPRYVLHQEDTYLTVQNIKFHGNQQHYKRPRTSFKYKNLIEGRKHRMFVKQVVEGTCSTDDEHESQLTSYCGDYSRYLASPARSTSCSGRTHTTKLKENKAVQTETAGNKTVCNQLKKTKNLQNNVDYVRSKIETKDSTTIEDTKVAFSKSGKRKSLTLSRAQSPESIQVIRVDVVCNNYSAGSLLLTNTEDQTIVKCENSSPPQNTEQHKNNLHTSKCYYSNKYLLTNSYKKLEQNIAGGTKVTLLCKTFRLLDRNKSKTLKNKNEPK